MKPGKLVQNRRYWLRQLETADPDETTYRRQARTQIALIHAKLATEKRCRICGRRITDSRSVERGIGPDCWIKVVSAYENAKERRFDEPLEEVAWL